jgi:hypothetical protein
MECRDAQFYLRLRRHAADELGADVTGALDAHCAGCPECAADARSAALFDRAMVSAMKAVPVPAGLREKLFTQASAKQGAILRRKMYQTAAACAAALVLLAIIFGVFSNTRPKVDTDELVRIADERVSNPEEATKRWLVAQKLPDELPKPFDYNLLVDWDTKEIQGRKVPVLVFRSSLPNDNGFAKVYIFREDGRFDLKGLQDAQASSARAQVIVGQDRLRGVTYVIIHTGPDLAPFLRNRNAPVQPA